MSRVAVNKDVLKWAIDRSDQSIAELALRFPKLPEWLDGKSEPTLRQLEGFARATLTPFGQLLLDAPPEERLPIQHFRTVNDATVGRASAELLETIRTMLRRQAWVREFLMKEGQKPLDFVGSSKLTDAPKAVADRVRTMLGFRDEGWAGQCRTWDEANRVLREAMESIGIFAMANGVVGNNTSRKLNTEEFRGFVLVDEYAPLVFVNGADSKSAQMFTLAHELAHVFIGKSAAFDLRQTMPAEERSERFCNAVAAEFLVPANRIRTAWAAAQHHQEPFDFLARQFKVSPIVAARRALDTGLISRDEFSDYYKEYVAREKRPQSGGDFYASQMLRVGVRFADLIVRAVREGKALYTEAYALTGLHGHTFDAFAANFG